MTIWANVSVGLRLMRFCDRQKIIRQLSGHLLSSFALERRFRVVIIQYNGTRGDHYDGYGSFTGHGKARTHEEAINAGPCLPWPIATKVVIVVTHSDCVTDGLRSHKNA